MPINDSKDFTIELEFLFEARIRKALFDSLKGSDRVVVEEWRGWPIKTAKGRSEEHLFRRPFDLATFERKDRTLILTGYEVKGVDKVRKKAGVSYRYPSFGEGLDQALVLLHQGADFSYLVHPEPKEDNVKAEMKSFLERFASPIGLIFVTSEALQKQGYLFPYKQAERNYADENEKRRLLTSLLSGGYFREIHIVDWARKHEY